MRHLVRRAVLGVVGLAGGLGIVIFGPAWTLDYWQGWAYLVLFVVLAELTGVWLLKKNPMLLERRIHAGPWAEKEKKQKLIMSLALLAFAGLNVVPSLDHRFGWSDVPTAVVAAGDVLVVVGFFLTWLVLTENTFAASTVEVVPGQTVISTGLYAVVRHPMYSGGLVIFLGTPLALGSWWGLLVVVLGFFVLAWRLLDEEEVLSRDLPGYTEYCRKVRYRLVPFVW